MLAALVRGFVLLCCFTRTFADLLSKSRSGASSDEISAREELDTNEVFFSPEEEFQGSSGHVSFLSRGRPTSGTSKQQKTVWIPSWPRAGSTTIFSMVLAAARPAEESEAMNVRQHQNVPTDVLQCKDFAAQGGCEWTSRLSCPGQAEVGTDGKASNDGSSAFHCCCRVLPKIEAGNWKLKLPKSIAAHASKANASESQNVSFMALQLTEPSGASRKLETPEHFGLFEPCHSPEMGHKTLPDLVEDKLKDNCKLSMTRLLECNFTGMEYLWGWRRPHTDISGLGVHRGMPSFNPTLARSKCELSSLVVYKTVASFGRSMDDVLPMLKNHQHVYAVVPVRDPRAIYSSWKELAWEFEGSKKPGVELLKNICEKMSVGIDVHHKRLRRVRFERLVQSPKEVVAGVYNFLGIDFGTAQERWLNETFNAECKTSKQDEGKTNETKRFRTCHESSLDSLTKWRNKLTEAEALAFKEDPNCQIVAKAYNYEL